MEKDKILEEIIKHNQKIYYLESLNNNLVYWDTLTSMPKGGIDERIELISFLSKELFTSYRDEKFLKNLKKLESYENNPKKVESMLNKIREGLNTNKFIPIEEYIDYKKVLNQAEEMWRKAREANDFKVLLPHLELVVDYLRKFADYAGYEDFPYEGILKYNLTNFNISYRDLKSMIENIKEFSLDMLSRIQKTSLVIDESILTGYFDENIQFDLTRDLLTRIGFDFNHGRLDKGYYPTVLPISNKDVRILTDFKEDNLLLMFDNGLHIGSQGLYEQSISSELKDYLLAKPASMIVLEAVSSFYKNYFGKTRSFWQFYYPLVQNAFSQLENVEFKDFYSLINKVKPSYLRNNSDELTYNLHTIIRFELEEELINGDLEVRDLPRAWNKKYKDYLGITPPNDLLGVLQDVHWVSGYFGYVVNYIIGNLFGAQLRNVILQELPHLDEELKSGNLLILKEWIETKILIHGSLYSTEELIYVVTDEELQEKYLLNYLEEKYRDIYKL